MHKKNRKMLSARSNPHRRRQQQNNRVQKYAIQLQMHSFLRGDLNRRNPLAVEILHKDESHKIDTLCVLF